MKAMVDPQVPAWGEANKPRVFDFLRFLDGELAHRSFIAGETFTIADITGLVSVDFMKVSKLAVPDELDQCEALARGGFGTAEREGVIYPPALRGREPHSLRRGDDSRTGRRSRRYRRLSIGWNDASCQNFARAFRRDGLRRDP